MNLSLNQNEENSVSRALLVAIITRDGSAEETE